MRANFYMSISADTHTHSALFIITREANDSFAYSFKAYMELFICETKITWAHSSIIYCCELLFIYWHIVVVHFTISSYTKFTHSDRIFIFHPLGKWAYGFFFVFLNYSFAQIFCCAKDETRARNCNLLGCASDSLWGSRRIYTIWKHPDAALRALDEHNYFFHLKKETTLKTYTIYIYICEHLSIYI